MPEEVQVPVMSMEDAIKSTLNGVPENLTAPVADTAPVSDPITSPEPATPENTQPEVPVIDPNLPTAEVTEIVAPVDVVPVFDELAWIKEKFGPEYESIDVIKTKLTTPSAPVIPEFANDESKRIHEAIVAGKFDEVQKYLNDKSFVASLKDKSPEEVVKAGWIKEFDLTPAQADRRFSKQFGIDELLDDEDKEIEQKLVAKKIEKEAETYRTYFSQYETSITLPSFEIQAAPASAPQPDFSSPEAKKAIEYATELNKSIPLDVANINFEFSDNSLNLSGKVTIPKEPVEKIKTQLTGHEDAFIVNRWFTPEGELKADLFARDVYLLTNASAVLNAAVSQTYHKTIIGKLKDTRNIPEPGKVISGDFELSPEEQRRAEYRKVWM